MRRTWVKRRFIPKSKYGGANLRQALDNYIVRVLFEGEAGVREAANFLLGESRPLVPVDSGKLKESGEVVSKGGYKNRTPIYSVKYSAESKNGFNYAYIQHETPPPIYQHEQGQWKYLEQPFKENRERLLSIIADYIRRG